MFFEQPSNSFKMMLLDPLHIDYVPPYSKISRQQFVTFLIQVKIKNSPFEYSPIDLVP